MWLNTLRLGDRFVVEYPRNTVALERIAFLPLSAGRRSRSCVGMPGAGASRRPPSRGLLVSEGGAFPLQSCLNSLDEPEARLRPQVAGVQRLCGLWLAAWKFRWGSTWWESVAFRGNDGTIQRSFW